MSGAIAADSGWNVLLSQGLGPSSGDPLNPYASLGGQGMTQPPRRSNTLWWVLGIGGGVVLLLCCGCVGVGYFGWTGIMNFMGNMVKQQIENDPVIVEHIGEVESVTINLQETSREQQANPQRGRNVMAFDVKGSKGSGVVVGTQVQAPEPGYVLENAKLRKDGQEYPLSQ